MSFWRSKTPTDSDWEKDVESIKRLVTASITTKLETLFFIADDSPPGHEGPQSLSLCSWVAWCLCGARATVTSARHHYEETALSALASPEHVESHSGDQNRALHNILHEVRNVLERHAVIQARHKQRTEARAEDCAPPTHQARSSDDTGRNRIELEEHTSIRRPAADSRRVDDARHRRQGAHQAKDNQNVPADSDARKSRSVAIAANGIEI